MPAIPPEIPIFLAGSAVLAWLSRRPLSRPGSHGFYRFFAWECILALVVRNRVAWGQDPFSAHQVLSWVLLGAGIALAAAGLGTLRVRGGAGAPRDDGALYAWEKTGNLVTDGIFSYIRHPMYASLMALTWGAFWQDPGPPGAAAAVAGTLFLLATARVDERECLAQFGAAYAEYMRKTRRFVPFVV